MRVFTSRWIPLAASGQTKGQPIGQALHSRDGSGVVQRAPAAKKIRRIEKTQHQVGIGDGRFATALTIAGRTRIRAGALRSDRQQAGRVNLANRAAAGAQRDDVQTRQRDPRVGDRFAVGQSRLAVSHQSDVGGGAAHVERDQIFRHAVARQGHGRGDASRRSGQSRAGGETGCLGDRGDAAMRQDDQQLAAVAGLRQAVAQTGADRYRSPARPRRWRRWWRSARTP